jgi:hypothetical protein
VSQDLDTSHRETIPRAPTEVSHQDIFQDHKRVGDPVSMPRSRGYILPRTFVRVNASGPVSGQAVGSVDTPLTWPASAAASHDHVCNSAWRVPSGQLWPSGLPTVIVQLSPARCASPLHPVELVMCATQPPEGGHDDLAVQEVWAPEAPMRFNE